MSQGAERSALYLDASASTPLDPDVLLAMCQALENNYANSASPHQPGRLAWEAIEEARAAVAQLIGARPSEVFFTSGATESVNLAIQGTVRAEQERPHLITTAVEHKAVLSTLDYLAQAALAEVTVLPVDRLGRVAPQQVRDALRPNTALVCFIHGNNEIGTLMDPGPIAEVLEGHRARLFVDAAQSGAFAPPNVDAAGVHLMCLSAHKMYGPKGIGALFVREGTAIEPLMLGGGHERGLRPGTMNTAAIVGFGIAARLATEHGEERADALRGLREAFLTELQRLVPDAQLLGCRDNRLPGHLSLRLPGVPAASLLRRLPELAFSDSSACASAAGEVSHVLRAVGLDGGAMSQVVRVGLLPGGLGGVVSAAARIGREAVVVRGLAGVG